VDQTRQRDGKKREGNVPIFPSPGREGNQNSKTLREREGNKTERNGDEKVMNEFRKKNIPNKIRKIESFPSNFW
jgi:hypothetical protein